MKMIMFLNLLFMQMSALRVAELYPLYIYTPRISFSVRKLIKNMIYEQNVMLSFSTCANKKQNNQQQQKKTFSLENIKKIESHKMRQVLCICQGARACLNKLRL